MAHDIKVETKRWQIRKVVNLSITSIRVNTILNAAGRYETAVFHTDGQGNIRDIGIKFYKKHESMQEAIDFNNFFCQTLKSENFEGLNIDQFFKKLNIIFSDFIYTEGPHSYIMPSKNPPNVAIGQKQEDM